ncbi:MAG: Rieske 2Fe-2S domain-containing protein [Actinobacteria bacterium]|uniref:Rieske iron-sulfur protein n=1 Tax=freshwater metagenome TaxID=449393 RepID=A0A6J6X8Q8_9ZZZZ|nr:Rieske 2Fe-2S domain-containing protein [Actinomycetota bacterium]MSX82768.1 Rieske 2Fe-2S domain-containing protein [Actinomycetota bacterium]
MSNDSSSEIEVAGAHEIEHALRRSDTDPRAAQRAERQVALMFGGSVLASILFVVAFVSVKSTAIVDLPLIGRIGLQNLALGLASGLGLFLIGAGAIHWARKLMSDEEIVDERKSFASDDETRDAVVESFQTGVEESGVMKRPLIRRTLLAAMALMPIPAIVLLRDLGPLPETKSRETLWRKGSRIVTDISYRPIKPEDIPLGGLVAGALPADLQKIEEEEGNLNQRAKAAIILVRMAPDEIRSQQIQDGDFQGILAFSKICTHLGCPIALYEQRTKHLLCPCHQSTFDLADDGNVIFGPSARRLPQLAIEVDKDGYLVAKEGFREPVGPSFWERG